MSLTDLQTRIKLRNKWLYAGNIAIGVAIFSICTISAIPTSAMLYVASFHIFGHETMYNIVSKLPEFMQFIEVGGVEHEINSGFYFAMACTIIAAILIGCALYKMNANSKKIGENNCKSKILNIKENQTISLYQINGKAVTDEGKNCVTLKERYPCVCIVKSKSGKKIVKLEYLTMGQSNDYEYQVVEYKNTEKPKITKENLREDFFKKDKTSRDNVTVYSIALDTISKLSDVVFETHSKKEKIESSVPPK